ncbi:hypothetical protein ACG83_16905 [Frankia sp. R43]|uniref:hypothetical protein n=1 Tax=Frankia sp. R43 TaxID=269536 RepID=UPI0006CA0457|nr:hypothetical protein [Frankia sp. R43]KPM55024.1 hypothetical protein ACG83_16905 [Frankia sp. R43]
MGVIEAEFTRNQFSALAQCLMLIEGLPTGSLAVLGHDRLITRLDWGLPTIVSSAPGVPARFGVLLLTADVTISHVSIAELDADPAAMTKTTGTATLTVTAVPGEGALQHLRIDLVALAIPSRPPSEPAFSLGIARRDFPVPAGVRVVGAAVLASDQAVTIRFVTGDPGELTAPTADRVVALDGAEWCIRISGEVFREQLLTALKTAIADFGAGMAVEEQPVATWQPLGPFGTGDWGVVGGFGVKKLKACSGPFGDVDLSVDVTTRLALVPDIEAKSLTTRFVIDGNASDWDSFRCWAAKGGPLTLLLAVVNPVPAIALAALSLGIVGSMIADGVHNQVTGADSRGDLRKVASDDSSATYEGTQSLPAPLPTALVQAASAGPDGLVVSGKLGVPFGINHRATFAPAAEPLGQLQGDWVGGITCEHGGGWRQTFELPNVRVTADAMALATLVMHVPVTVFRSSTVLPAEGWELQFDGWSARPEQRIAIVGNPAAAGSVGRAFLHTSAGIRRYDLAGYLRSPSGKPIGTGPVPAPPPAPDPARVKILAVDQCRRFGRDWHDPRIRIGWLVDPPPFTYGVDALRHWQLAVSEIPGGATVTVTGHRDGADDRRLVALSPSDGTAVAIELVTDAATELTLEHDLPAAPDGARLIQRWLLPTQVVALPAPAASLFRLEDGVGVRTVDGGLTVWSPTGEVREVAGAGPREEPAGAEPPPFSVTLRDGRVAAIHDDRLVVAIPFGNGSRTA